MRSVIILICSMLLATLAMAQDAKVTLKASKSEVAVGEQFRIILSADVNGNGDISVPREFQIISQMSGSSTKIFNGQHSFEVTRTYVVIANAKGEFTIPAATWTYNGKTAKSNSLKIKVVEGAGTPPNQQQQQYYDPFGSFFGTPQQQPQTPSSEKHFGMFATSKREVYVGEPVILSGKVYFDGQIVDIADFEPYKIDLMAHKTDLRSDKVNISVGREDYGGKTYQTVPLFEDLIIPQQAGAYTFTPFSIKVGYQRGFFDRGYKLIKSNEPSITVLPLPKGVPSGFDGAVGTFKVDVKYDAKAQMQAGDVFGITVKIEGTGNVHLLKALELNLPEGLVLYGDPKVENKVKISRKGGQGTIAYDFIVQVVKGGEFNFKPLEFAYFNPELKRYEQVNVPDLKFEATGELISEQKAAELAQIQEEEKVSSQVWKSITLGLLGLLFLFGLIYFLRKNSNLFKIKTKKRKVDAHAVALKALGALHSNDAQTLDAVEKIILQFFKDFTSNEKLLVSVVWFEQEASQHKINTEHAQLWRAHFSTIQAMKYANFGQMSSAELIGKTKELVEKTRS